MGSFPIRRRTVSWFYEGGYEELFKGFSAGVLNNRESLFEVSFYYPGTKGYWGTYIGIIVDAPANSADANKVMGRAAVSYRAVPEWYDLYEAQDVRRDVAIGRHSWTWNKTTGVHEKTDLSKKKATGPLPSGDANGCRPAIRSLTIQMSTTVCCATRMLC